MGWLSVTLLGGMIDTVKFRSQSFSSAPLRFDIARRAAWSLLPHLLSTRTLCRAIFSRREQRIQAIIIDEARHHELPTTPRQGVSQRQRSWFEVYWICILMG